VHEIKHSQPAIKRRVMHDFVTALWSTGKRTGMGVRVDARPDLAFQQDQAIGDQASEWHQMPHHGDIRGRPSGQGEAERGGIAVVSKHARLHPLPAAPAGVLAYGGRTHVQALLAGAVSERQMIWIVVQHLFSRANSEQAARVGAPPRAAVRQLTSSGFSSQNSISNTETAPPPENEAVSTESVTRRAALGRAWAVGITHGPVTGAIARIVRPGWVPSLLWAMTSRERGPWGHLTDPAACPRYCS
jgi:hypothetical protein